MRLYDKVNEALKDAMRNKDATRLASVRALRGEIIKLEKNGTGEPVSDEDIVRLVKAQIKQRRDAVAMFEKGDRADLIASEENEIVVLSEFLPPQLSEDQIRQIVADVIAKVDARGMKDMGKVMKETTAAIRATGKDADNRSVSGIVKTALC